MAPSLVTGCSNYKNVQLLLDIFLKLTEYEAAAIELKGWGIHLAKVDGTREKELADQYQIGGWPGFKMFRKGRVYEYKGPREKDNIIEFMRRQSLPPTEEKKHFLGISNNLDRTEITGK